MNNIALQPEPTISFMIEGAFNDTSEYIAAQILPEVTSETLRGNIGRMDEGALRIVSTATKGLTKNVVSFKFDKNATFEVGDHSLENVINAADAEGAGGWQPAKDLIGALLADEILRSREHALASALTSTTVMAGYTETLTGGDQWTTSTSDVLAAIERGKVSIETATGKQANVIIMGAPTRRALAIHPQIIAVLSPGKNTPGLYNDEQLAAALGVDKIIVGRAIYNSAKEGQTSTRAFIWGDNCIVAYIAPSGMARVSKTLGASIACPSKAPKQYARSYVPEGKSPEQVQVLVAGANWEDKLITVGAGYLIYDTNA
jgi:hypothetical protein